MGYPSGSLADSYNRLAEEYAKRYFEELKHKPLDRKLLDRLAAECAGLGPVCDLGCGPGQIARYLHGRGVEAFGVDLAPGMVDIARRLNPGIEFVQGDMTSLDVEDGSWGGIAAFYSLIHIPREDVVRVLTELKRVLCPGGWLLLSFHVGEETMHIDELWGEEVSMDFLFFPVADMRSYIDAAGFELVETIERPPYEGVEYESRRAYIFARKPAGAA